DVVRSPCVSWQRTFGPICQPCPTKLRWRRTQHFAVAPQPASKRTRQMQATATMLDLQAHRPSTVRWKIFLMMLFLISINYIDRASLSVAMPLIAKEFDIGPALQGLLLSSFFWTYALMQIPGGMLADRFGPRVTIAAATLGWGFFQAIAAVCTGWVSLLATRLGLGAAEAPIYPAGGKLN